MNNQTIFARISPFRDSRFVILFWLFVFIVILAIAAYVAAHVPYSKSYFVIMFFIAMGLTTVPAAFSLCQHVFENWTKLFPVFVLQQSEGAVGFFLQELRFFSGDRHMFASGVFIAVVACVSYAMGDVFSPYGTTGKVFGCIIVFFSACAGGMGLYAVFCGSRAVWRLGKHFDVRVAAHKFGVMSTGVVLLKSYIVIAIVFSFYVLSVLITEQVALKSEKLLSLPMLTLSIPALLFFAASFIVCQIPLHRQMRHFKQRRLVDIEAMLDELVTRSMSDLSPEVIEQVEFLRKERVAVLKLPEWPFGMKISFAVLLSSATSVWPIVLNTLMVAATQQSLSVLMGWGAHRP